MKQKWVVGLILVLCLGGLALKWRGAHVNAAVAETLRLEPQSARAARTMLITLADGREFPVNYLRDGDLVFMGIDGRWWRAFQNAGQPVTMLIQGETLTGHARVILDDPALVEAVFARLRPTVPEWLPDALNGKLVAIRLK
ncbi:MAG: hypothetical protein P8N63_12390 [Pseudomonadales bacterium]|nr:hypothetical protein [Pseudomonadales bacterium]